MYSSSPLFHEVPSTTRWPSVKAITIHDVWWQAIQMAHSLDIPCWEHTALCTLHKSAALHSQFGPDPASTIVSNWFYLQEAGTNGCSKKNERRRRSCIIDALILSQPRRGIYKFGEPVHLLHLWSDCCDPPNLF